MIACLKQSKKIDLLNNTRTHTHEQRKIQSSINPSIQNGNYIQMWWPIFVAFIHSYPPKKNAQLFSQWHTRIMMTNLQPDKLPFFSLHFLLFRWIMITSVGFPLCFDLLVLLYYVQLKRCAFWDMVWIQTVNGFSSNVLNTCSIKYN